MQRPIYKESIKAGPFSIHFCNQNTEMELRGHCHFAQVYFEFETLGAYGFPSFAHTHAEIQGHLVTMTATPFRKSTNEVVLRKIFEFFRSVELKETLKYRGAKFRLAGMELHVRGVPDEIGHADSFTVYKIKE